jgi:hypothetical protein
MFFKIAERLFKAHGEKAKFVHGPRIWLVARLLGTAAV